MVEGFSVIGEVGETNIFKALPDQPTGFVLDWDFFGKSAETFVDSLEKQPPKAPAPELKNLSTRKLEKGRFF